MISDISLSLSPPRPPPSSSVCFHCQFCWASVSQGSVWTLHGQTHSKPVQLISILHTSSPSADQTLLVSMCFIDVRSLQSSAAETPHFINAAGLEEQNNEK